MSWLLAGYCGLALISISGALNNTLRVTQRPRFCGAKTNHFLILECLPFNVNWASVKWYKANKYNDELKKRVEIKSGQRFELQNSTRCEGANLHIKDLRVEDRGVYFCKINNTWGPGTELQVARPVSQVRTLFRTKLKDGLIIFQALLLAMYISVLLRRKQKQSEKRDSIYEEPETDHIYAGLEIEEGGGGLYEELSVYAQPEGAEAPWE